MGRYPVVDLRPRLAGSPKPSQGTVAKKTSVTLHYNGPAVKQDAVSQLLFDAKYHIQKNWGTASQPAYTNGVQYEWAVGQDGTKYRLRNPRSILWHCAHPTGNAYSYAVTFLIGEGQRITKAAMEAAAELVDELRVADGIARSQVFGHQEWSSTECPGSAQGDFVVPYRQGRIAAAPAVALPSYRRMTVFHADTEWSKPRALFFEELAKSGAGVSVETDQKRIAAYSDVVLYSEPVGSKTFLALGHKTEGLLSSGSRDVLGEYGADVSDCRRGFTDREVLRELRVMERRGIVPDGTAKKYRKKFIPKAPTADVPATPAAPNPSIPSVSVSREAGIIDRFFGTPYGQIIVEEADRAGLALNAACALVEQESNGRNIFGADWGTRGADRIPFAHMPVTEARVKALVGHVKAGGVSNGVGLTQLTWRDFIYEAEALGGAHLVRNQLRVGFKLLSSYFGKYGEQDGYGSYNAGEGNRASVRGTYSASCIQKSRAWRTRLS